MRRVIGKGLLLDVPVRDEVSLAGTLNWLGCRWVAFNLDQWAAHPETHATHVLVPEYVDALRGVFDGAIFGYVTSYNDHEHAKKAAQALRVWVSVYTQRHLHVGTREPVFVVDLHAVLTVESPLISIGIGAHDTVGFWPGNELTEMTGRLSMQKVTGLQRWIRAVEPGSGATPPLSFGT
jgi:hypothetical protein